jgi:hypothetical protein
MVEAIMGERDFVHVLVEGFLLGAIENHSWFCPVINPIGIIGK